MNLYNMLDQQQPFDEAGSSTNNHDHKDHDAASVAPSTSSKTRDANASVGKEDREVDNIALAAILRESAEFVERGEFDAIMYQALQDFRAYYKQKYPKVKRAKSKEDGKKKSKKKSQIVTAVEEVTAEVVSEASQDQPAMPGRSDSAAATVEKVEEEKIEAEGVKEETAETVESTPASVPVNPEESDTVTEEVQGPEIVTPTLVATPAAVPLVHDYVAPAMHPVMVETAVPLPSVEEPSSTPKIETPNISNVSNEHNVAPTPVPVPAAVPVVTQYVAPPGQPVRVETAVPLPRAAAAAPSAPRMVQPTTHNHPSNKFNMGSAVFGSFKLPKLQKGYQAAMAATTKKNPSYRPRDGLDVFQNELAKQAQASARRPAVSPTSAPSPSYSNHSVRSVSNTNDNTTHLYDFTKTRTFSENTADNDATELTGHAGGGHARAAEKTAYAATTTLPTGVEEPSHGIDDCTQHFRTDHGQVTAGATATAIPTATAATAVAGQPQHQDPTLPTPPSRNVQATHHDDPSVVSDGHSVTSGSHKTHDTAAAVRPVPDAPHSTGSATVPSTSTATTATAAAMDKRKKTFQTPSNKSSALIANGWIEQYRRSKMRLVWKEVLASLVEGRKPGEETTLWIQREIFNPTTGKAELEALHQIPVKFLQEITLKEHTTDHQFTLKIFNSNDEFVFRCSDAPLDAMRWVQTLKEAKSGRRGNVVEEEKKGPDVSLPQYQQQAQPQPQPQPTGISQEIREMGVRDLIAMCHGAGISTNGMERSDLERAAEEVKRRGTYFDQRGAPAPAPPHQPPTYHTTHPVVAGAAAAAAAGTPHFARPPPQQQHQQQVQVPPTAVTNGSSTHQEYASVHSGSGPAAAAAAPPQVESRLSVKELRAICHGAGIKTVGMERGELERAAEEVRKRGTYFDPPPGMHAPTEEEYRARQEEYRRHQEEVRARQDELRRQEELRARQDELRRQKEQEAERLAREEAYRIRAEEEARRRRVEEERLRREAEERQRQLAEEDARLRAAAEEEARRRTAAAEEEARRRAAEAEHLKRVAEEQRRQTQEAQIRYQQQQAAWQKQQQEEEQRRRQAEQHAAEQRRLHEEALRKQQKWAGASTAQSQQQAQQQWNQQQQQRSQPYPHQQQQPGWQQQPQRYPQQQQPQQQTRNTTPPPQPQQRQQQQQQQQQQQHHEQSAASQKYAKMANQSEEDGQAAITRIKHDLLIQWALQPPQLQMLRPIDGLIMTVHKVFPPALGVAGHEYFSKWTPITRAEIAGTTGLPDEEKLKKSVRKIRFFLHPDKLPRDLNEEQKFMTKMLWDVLSDAWDEFQKHREELDWIR